MLLLYVVHIRARVSLYVAAVCCLYPCYSIAVSRVGLLYVVHIRAIVSLFQIHRLGLLYVIHFRALLSLYQINTDKCTHMLLNHHFINSIRNSNIFRLLKGHLQSVYILAA